MSPTSKPSRRRKRLIIATAVVGGVGLACYFVPGPYQVVCHLCAKLLGVLLGAP